MSAPLDKISLFQYSLLALPLAFVGLPLYIHAPDFYAANVGLSLTTIGIIILAVRLFDAVQDPVIGVLSNKFSHLRPAIMLGGMLVLAAGLLMVFHPPDTLSALWFALSLILATTAFSIISINFNALGSLWSKDTNQKTRITTWREGVGLAGLLVGAVLPSIFGLHIVSYILVGILALCGLAFMRWNSAHADIITHNEGAHDAFKWRTLLHEPNIRFFGVYALSMFASAIPAVLVIFFIRDRLDAEALTGLFLFLYFISGAAGMPLWQYLAKRMSKYRAWMVGMIVAAVTFIWAYFLGAGDVWQYAMICVFSGLALGAELALPPAILSDMIDKQDNRGQTSLYFSALTFLLKATLALGSGVAFLLLGQAAFVPAAQNSAQALGTLSFTYALLPCLIKIAAALMLWRVIKHEENGG